MSLVGAVVTPHPPIVVPEVGRTRLGEVADTVEALRRLGEKTAALAPRTLVLLSPHAPLAMAHMGVGVAPRYRGSLGQFGVPEVSVELEGEVNLGEGILRSALDRQVPVEPLGSPERTTELDHGALVPLYFLLEGVERPPSLVLLSFSFQGAPAHLDFGRAIAAAVQSHEEPVLFVASGDLSHRLTPDAPAGYDPRGQDFDRRVVEAVRGGSESALLAIPDGLREAAGECGYRSLLVLFGLLESVSYETEVLSYEGPFGVGYLVADVAVGGGAARSAEEVA